MPNKIIGSSEIVSGVIQPSPGIKRVYIIGAKGTAGSMTDLQSELTISKDDAEAKIGTGTTIPDLVEAVINNGGREIYLTTIDTVEVELDDKYNAALDLISNDDARQSIIILDIAAEATVTVAIKAWLSLMETANRHRYYIPGIVAGDDTIPEHKTAALAFADKRIIYPGTTTLEAGGGDTSGTIQAARFAGIFASETADPALPLNSVVVQGPIGLKDVITTVVADDLVDNQVTAMIANGGNIEIYRTVTTSTDANYEAFTTVLTEDYTLDRVLTRLKTDFKRNKKSDRILNAIRDSVIDELLTVESLEIIEDFDQDSVVVRADPQDSFGALVDYAINIVTPLYTLTVKQNLTI